MAENERNPKAQLSQSTRSGLYDKMKHPNPSASVSQILRCQDWPKFDILAIDMLAKLVWKCLGDQIWSASFG
jgi:hypothetical protein